MKTIANIIGIVAIAAALLYILTVGWNRTEIVECEKWLEQSRQYVGWYSTDWQREQCKAHGYELPERYKR